MSKPVVVAAFRGDLGDGGVLAFALEYAHSFDAVLRVVGLGGVAADVVRARIQRARMATLTGPEVDIRTRTGEPDEALLDEAADATALVVGTSDDEQTAVTDPLLVEARRSTPCLLLEVSDAGALVRATGMAPRVTDVPTRRRYSLGSTPVITVGFDGTVPSREALAWALQHADAFNARLEVVTAIASRAWSAETRSDAARSQRTAIRAIPTHGVSVATAIVRGETVDVLMRLSKRAELLVLGRHSLPAGPQQVLGSVTDACTRVSSCPVVVVATAHVTVDPVGRTVAGSTVRIPTATRESSP